MNTASSSDKHAVLIPQVPQPVFPCREWGIGVEFVIDIDILVDQHVDLVLSLYPGLQLENDFNAVLAGIYSQVGEFFKECGSRFGI